MQQAEVRQVEVKQSRYGRVICLAGLLSIVVACSDGGGSSRPSEASRAALSRVLQAQKNSPVWAGSVAAEVSDLIRLRQFAEIEFVDVELRRLGERERRRTVHHRVSAAHADPDVLALLRRLAARDSEPLQLAPFREGGVAHLLRVLEDDDAATSDRMTSAYVLGQFGGLEEMSRMKPFSESVEQRMLETPNESLDGETLGSVVRESIRSIHERVRSAQR